LDRYRIEALINQLNESFILVHNYNPKLIIAMTIAILRGS
jgi:hypothetical protein